MEDDKCQVRHSRFLVKDIEVFEIVASDQVPAAGTRDPCPDPPGPAVEPQPNALDSQILYTVPQIFPEFNTKEIVLLWRGSRDGFGAADFHRLCNGHPNTLTVIFTTDGYVFGGFTPVAWESPEEENSKADPSEKTCLFTLTNSYGVPPRKFAIYKAYMKSAITCDAKSGPMFGGWELYVSDQCHANSESDVGRFGNVFAK